MSDHDRSSTAGGTALQSRVESLQRTISELEAEVASINLTEEDAKLANTIGTQPSLQEWKNMLDRAADAESSALKQFREMKYDLEVAKLELKDLQAPRASSVTNQEPEVAHSDPEGVANP